MVVSFEQFAIFEFCGIMAELRVVMSLSEMYWLNVTEL